MKKLSLFFLVMLILMSFTTMAFAEIDVASSQQSETTTFENKNEEEFEWDYGYERVTRSYAWIFRYIFIGIAALAALTMIIVEKKQFYRKPDPNEDPNKPKSTFDRIFKV
ncbi:MAG: hypothetical protein WC996_04685 [Peptostreptococcales bacterium]